MKKLLIITLLLIATLSTYAQVRKDSDGGVHFEHALTWQQVLAKAKTEHKDVFVDCYATWCQPCKWMEANVYPIKEVGDIYDSKFICIKLQMDKTAQDIGQIKAWYKTAAMFAHNYRVDAYPTFLFFDADGKPLHRESGSLDARGFMGLAADAQNPAKQYYHILADFKPDRLDTADEKGLARSLFNTDEKLAGQLAADYLGRIPKSQLSRLDNGRLMVQFKKQPQVTAIIVAYLKTLKGKFNDDHNLQFLDALQDQPAVKALILAYIGKLRNKDLSNANNQTIISWFNNEPQVIAIATAYINKLPEEKLYDPAMIRFLSRFDGDPDSRAFRFLYDHPGKINGIMKDSDFVQVNIGYAIYGAEITPKLVAASKTDSQPDFDAMSAGLSRRYNARYAKDVIADARVNWYGQLVHQKKQSQYWPQLIQAEVDREQDQLNKSELNFQLATQINNTCYNDIFLHSDDIAKIVLGVRWMAQIMKKYPQYSDMADTYACVLYKAGQVEESLKEEDLIIQFCIDNKAKGTYTMMKHATLAMQKIWIGEKIWEEKEFQ